MIIFLSARIDAPWFTENLSYWVSQLNSVDAHRYSSMKSQRKQQQMLLSRALIAKALLQLNSTLMLDNTYEINNFSTLVLGNSSQTFSISITHSGDMAAIILSDQPVKLGIDIELIKKRNFTELTQEICTAQELTLINERNDIEADFYQLWTVKESLAKASQSQLSHLYQCDCSAALTHDSGMVDWQGDNYTVNHINIAGYKGSYVTNTATKTILTSVI